MKVLIFGATGMIGHGVLRECLLAPDVQRVLTLGRHASGLQHPRLTQREHADLYDYRGIETELSGWDACFFCLGVSAAGRTEADYSHLTYDLTLAAARTLARLNPQMTFVYVSGAGTDRTESGRSMWARVKGRTENDLLKLPFKAVYLFRPGLIQPLYGASSRTRAYRILYKVLWPLLPLLRRLAPDAVLTTQSVGQAMLCAVRHGAAKPVLESRDIAALARHCG